MGKRNRISGLCVLCRQDDVDEVKFGKLHRIKHFRVHYYCLLLSETITQSGKDEEGILGFLASDIEKELDRSKAKKCCYCNEMMATLGCVHKHCNRKFHLHCGYANNAMFHFDKFTAHCNLHTKPSNLPVQIKKTLKDYFCLICLDQFDSETKFSDVYWATCCRARVVLHTDCLRHMALSAGYFTKCPGCNDKTKFIDSIKMWGIFVPERDASWELDGNAFSDLLYVHNTCDAQNCVCPEGRDFSKENGTWKIVLCKTCGSVGTHVGCTEHKTHKRKFLCDVCSLKREESNVTTSNNLNTEHKDSNSETVSDKNDYNEEEFIEIEVCEDSESIINSHDNDNCNIEIEYEKVESLDDYSTKENTDVLLHEVFPDLCPEPERKSLKRSFKDITNSSDNDFNEKGLVKKLKEDQNGDYEYEKTKTLNIGKELDNASEKFLAEVPQITNTIEVHATSLHEVKLDEDSEVEFISCTIVDSKPTISVALDNVELFLNSVIAKPRSVFKEKSKCSPKRRKKRKLLNSCELGPSGRRIVQLSLENFIARTSV